MNNVAAERQNWDQQKERFIRGVITDSKGKQWDVILIPGAVDINEDAVESWRRSGRRVGDLFDGDFWDSVVYSEFKAGFRFSETVAKDHFWSGIGDEFTDTVEKNRDTKGEFGHMFFSGLRWSWFGTRAMGRTVWLPIGTALGVSYSLVVPLGAIVWKPVGSALDVSVCGSTWPVIMYLWNGTSWIGTVLSPVPSRETWLVRVKKGARYYEIDRIGFDALLHGNVLQFLTEEEKVKLQQQIDSLQEQVDSIASKQDPLHEDMRKKDDALRGEADYVAMQEILEQARHSDRVELSEIVNTVYLDDTKLEALIEIYLEKLGVEDVEKMRTQKMIESLKDSVESVLHEMSEKKPEQETLRERLKSLIDPLK